MDEKDMCPDCNIPLVYEEVWREGMIPVCPDCGWEDLDDKKEE